jgi:uncharacterized protein (TIGR03000 family)
VTYYPAASSVSPAGVYAYQTSPSFRVIAQQQTAQPTATTVARIAPESKPAAPAHVTVNLPSDAKLFIDDVSCPLTSDMRTFNTPALKQGQKYFYDVRAEVARDGTTVTETQRVVIEAGQQVSVAFPKLSVVTTAQR